MWKAATRCFASTAAMTAATAAAGNTITSTVCCSSQPTAQLAAAAATAAAAAAVRVRAGLQPAACVGSTAAAFSTANAALQQQQQGDVPPGQAFLNSLVDYEKIGVPKAAGVATAASAAAAAPTAVTSSSGGNSTLGSDSSSGGGSNSSSSNKKGGSSSPSFDLATMRQLLAAMGNPQQQLPVVHIAGTKGKGSVAALISGVLRAAGYRVGTYSSPHLFDIRERIVVGGSGAPWLRPQQSTAAAAAAAATTASGSQTAAAAAAVQEVPEAVPVSVQEFEALALRAADAVAAMQQQQQQQQQHEQRSLPHGDIASPPSSSSSSTMPSHFEVVTAMALQHFVNAAVDIAVIETGLGGATDATNVFGPQQLQLAVLTAVGMDHVEALGGSLGSIAAAKAGIMKPGVPVVVGPQPGSTDGSDGGCSGSSGGSSSDVVMQVFRQVAEQLGCPLVLADTVVKVTPVTATTKTDINSSSSSTSSGGVVILPGPGAHLARQAVSITAESAKLTGPATTTAPAASGGVATTAAAAAPPAHASTAPTPANAAGSLNSARLDLPQVQLQLVGQHQAGNVQTAVTAALLLAARGWRGITAAAVQQGLEAAWLTGRFQVAQLAGSPTHYVLDGAHTADSAAALAQTLRDTFPTQPVVLVVAMAADKQHREVLQALRVIRPRVAIFTSVPIAGSHARSAPPGTLAAHWQAAAMLSTGKPFRCRELIQAGLGAALDKARHELGAYEGKGVVVVTGSLHAVAAGLKQLQLA